MKTIEVASLVLVLLLSSCNTVAPIPSAIQTTVMETAKSMANTAIVQTQTAAPTATRTPTSTPTVTISPIVILLWGTGPTGTPLPPTQTPFPISMTPKTTIMENGLEWMECTLANHGYSHEGTDIEFLEQCVDFPAWNEHDKQIVGERIKNKYGWVDLWIKIGEDVYKTIQDNPSAGCCSYRLIKNGREILRASPGFLTFDPNRNFWNVEGKLVWEVAGGEQFIMVDGVNYNTEHQLEGSYYPYEIGGKLIYIAKQNGQFHIVYDGKSMGPEFDSIQMGYCCSPLPVYRGSGQYWFLGSRGGNMFLVLIKRPT